VIVTFSFAAISAKVQSAWYMAAASCTCALRRSANLDTGRSRLERHHSMACRTVASVVPKRRPIWTPIHRLPLLLGLLGDLLIEGQVAGLPFWRGATLR
jgi:hypothetical protein